MRFQGQTREIEIHAYYQNYCIDSNQILHSDKDHQMPFAGGPPNIHITNPRWRTAVILEKSKNRHISATVGPIATRFGRLTQFDPFRFENRPHAVALLTGLCALCLVFIFKSKNLRAKFHLDLFNRLATHQRHRLTDRQDKGWIEQGDRFTNGRPKTTKCVHNRVLSLSLNF